MPRSLTILTIYITFFTSGSMYARLLVFKANVNVKKPRNTTCWFYWSHKAAVMFAKEVILYSPIWNISLNSISLLIVYGQLKGGKSYKCSQKLSTFISKMEARVQGSWS